MQSFYPVIMCGGVGTRLWPISRKAYPKQFLPLASQRSMLLETVDRLKGTTAAKPIFLCNEEHRFLVASQIQEIGLEGAPILLEPEGRNTAPAIALAAFHVARTDPSGVLAVLAADHVISKTGAFLEALEKARIAAEKGHLVAFGIEPDSPNTGYGYIKSNESAVAEGVYGIDQFVEKPDAQTAQDLVADGSYRWNSGMFVFQADRYLEELKLNAPDIFEACQKAMASPVPDLDFIRPNRDAFLACRSDSIDYAVMEKCKRAAVVPCDLGWSDVGSWAQLWDIAEKDEAGNASVGDAILVNTKGSYVRSEGQLVAVVGCEDIVVVSTPDVVMVAPRKHAQDVKYLVDAVKTAGRSEHETHTKAYRPWGFYESVHNGERHQVKHIQVYPGAKLSLQKHFHRAEHWVVVKGTAIVTRDEEEIMLTENESVYLPLGCVHRLENPGKVPLSLVEVQTGSYLGEDDIVRIEDIYSRS